MRSVSLKSVLAELSARQLEFHAAAPVVDLEIAGITQTSKHRLPNSIFCALPGAHTTGLDFAAQAVTNGAVAIFADSSLQAGSAEQLPEVPLIWVRDLRAALGWLSDYIFGTSDSDMRLFGVTGTNGKTSVTSYLQRTLEQLGVSTGLSATTQRLVGGTEVAATLTTPEVTELHWLLAQMREAGNSCAAIEVSAQALVRQRVDGLRFEVVGFTNLSRDHLDDFGDMQTYLRAKLRLFSNKLSARGVIFVADEFTRQAVALSEIAVVTIGTDCDWSYQYEAGEIKLSSQAITGSIAFQGSEVMARNLALAAVMLVTADFDADLVFAAASRIDPQVRGRLELVASGSRLAYIDYAHTPDAIAQALRALADKPWVTLIFSASGNRDTGKRVEMAQAASAANYVVVTDFHPRDEDPAAIRRELVAELSQRRETETFVEVSDVVKAAEVAVAHTPIGGTIIWCGPGHLKYREVRGEKLAFDASAQLAIAISKSETSNPVVAND